MKKLLRGIRKFFDKFPSSPGFIRYGRWRVKYPDGNRTFWFTYDCACNYQKMFGGEIEWMGDFEATQEETA